MIVQKGTGFDLSEIDPEKGFYVVGRDADDCMRQLAEWGSAHPEKWIYYHDAGMTPGKPVPAPENVFEVATYDAAPAGLTMFMWELFQEGCEGKREELTVETSKKQLEFLYLFGKFYEENRRSKDKEG